MTHLDFIGDIHGHLDKLCLLLETLGYHQHDGIYSHPERMAFFVGDYIDRGPNSPGVIRTVRSMVEAGSAIALMGNHEYNAICFNTPHPERDFLRPHTIKNFSQHAATLSQFHGKQKEYDEAISWFKTLPMWYEHDLFRAVHACWDAPSMDTLQDSFPDGRLRDDLLGQTADKSSALYQAVDVSLKGKEARLPDGYFFLDKDKHKRRDVRLKWWLDPTGRTFGELSMSEVAEVEKVPVVNVPGLPYSEDERPVFFGHYWLKGTPDLYRHNVCCLDFSVAKEGHLVAYRFDGEKALEPKKLVWV